MLLVAGVLLWSLAHLSIALTPQVRARLVAGLGLVPYKLAFSLVLVLALVMIVAGWRDAGVSSLWVPPAGMRHLTLLLVPIAVVLFLSARMPTDIKQLIRHPQLTGVKLWAVAHLLANGEVRSIILFGGLLAWAVAEVIVINRREGARRKPPRVGMLKSLLSAAAGLVVAALLLFAHPWIAGIPVMTHG
ncbi:NnrU family protein [Panacagrimonas sp.]|uniref:NnrU family protein n=1 Tax=Panacagrimonas sp. TaxID=2480088 RepID=UPI003B5299FF